MVQTALTLSLLAYFAMKLVFLAVTIDASVPPDEVSHMGIVRIYSQSIALPEDTAASIRHGPIAHQPFLYYWVMGRLLELNPFPTHDLLFMRLINCGLAFATVVYALRWICGATASPAARLLFLTLVTNTLMFTGLSASVSYDNLTNLLATAATFYLFRFHDSRMEGDLLRLTACVLAGCLTKTAFLPLAAILALALALHERRRLGAVARYFRWRPTSRRQLAACAGVAILLVANLALYGGNALRYRRLTPGLGELVGREAAMDHRIFARNAILKAYRNGEIELPRAMALANRIQHARDRETTRAMLNMTRQAGEHRLHLLRWAPRWGRLMVQRTYGYFGHRTLRRKPVERALYAGTLGIALLLFLARWRAPAHRGPLRYAALIGGAYIAVVMLGVNRVIYLQTGLVLLAVQGRYLFPVLAPVYGVAAMSLVDLTPKPMRIPLALVVAGIFLYGEFPFFLLHAGPEWYASGQP